jgi:hypothetical protein
LSAFLNCFVLFFAILLADAKQFKKADNAVRQSTVLHSD